MESEPPIEGLSDEGSERGVKRKKYPNKDGCPLKSCGVKNYRPRRHVINCHLPVALTHPPVMMNEDNVHSALQAVRWLVNEALGPETTLQEAVDYINTSGEIAPTKMLHPTLYNPVFTAACRILDYEPPKMFSLHPINSPAILIFWRCATALLNNCSLEVQKRFVSFVPVSEEVLTTSDSDSDRDSSVPEKVLTSSVTIHTPELEDSETELYEVDQFVVLDEVGSEAEDDVPMTTSEFPLVEREVPVAIGDIPSVFDSHFHLDRTSKKLFGSHKGHTVEELIRRSELSGSAKPGVKVKVNGGIVVYSEPETYPELDFVMQGPWRVAIGVHPKHYSTFTDNKLKLFIQLLKHPKVVAVGECGLDRTVTFQHWHKQEEVFLRILKLVKANQPLVIHLRGTREDAHGSDVNARCQILMEEHCHPQQRIHVHCFMGRADVVKTWLRKFPNAHFGITAAVRTFDSAQIGGLQAIPINRLLLETDSPHFPLGMASVNTPAYLGEIAAFAAVHLNMTPRDVMQHTLLTALSLYNL